MRFRTHECEGIARLPDGPSRHHLVVGYAIYYGIKTGFNDAFIIDNQTYQDLIAHDPKSREIIKPVVRGRDIRRYRPHWAGKWLIDTHNGYDNVPAVDIEEYPAVKAHLDSFYTRLARRYDKGQTPYNLRNCAYHEEFTREKLLWIELVNNGRFSYDNSGLYGEATTFLLTGESIKYLCALLNATLTHWFLEKTAPTSGTGTLRWKKAYVERLPVPKVERARELALVRLVERILANLDTRLTDSENIEEAIDRHVYRLYGLTEDEIHVISGK